MNWGDLGPYGTNLESTAPGVTASVDAGGVAVDITFEAVDPGATAFTFNAGGYGDPDDGLSDNSFLKLFDDMNDDGMADTASATLDFRATDTDRFTDQVQNVTFRLNDIDANATMGDLGEVDGGSFQDIITLSATNAAGEPVAVTITPETANLDVSGQTITGTTTTDFTDPDGSVLVTISEPVSSITIAYANGAAGQQGVTISDVNFTTVDTDGNLPPVANDDMASTPEDTAVIIDVLENDSDPEGGELTVTGATTDTGSVTVNADNTLTYTPPADYNGPAMISYTIEDPEGNSATGEVAVTVEPENGGGDNAPDAVDDTGSTTAGTPVNIDVLANDSDPEGQDFFTIDTSDPANGTAAIGAGGSVDYTPDDGFTGTDTFTYTIADDDGLTDTATVTVTVGTPNTPPVAVDDTATTEQDAPVTLDPTENDTDAEDDPLSVSMLGDPANGTATLNGDGSVTYTPNDGFTGEDTIPYTVSDGNGGTDEGEIIVTVTEPGPARIDTDVFPVDPADQALDPLDGLDEDPDPADDLDTVTGDGTAELIQTGDDDDTIDAGGGNDTVEPGIDDDLVDLGGGDDSLFDVQGADTITGGQGNDTIIAGVDTFSDYEGDDPAFAPGTPLNDLGFTADPNQDDGRDSVQGNLGNDSIATGDDDDTIDGGGDNDTIDAGIDDDLVMGGQGDDSLIGSHGSDTLDGGQGNDFIDGSNLAALELTDDVDPVPGNDRDSLMGALGDDTLIGGDDDDTLVGGSGDDSLDGGIDEDILLGGGDSDTLQGGQGNDTLNGGDGADSIVGGADQDVIIVDSASAGTNDTVDGGSEGDDFDRLDVSAIGTPGVDFRIVDTSPDSNGNGIDGTIEFLDGDGNVTGDFDFFEIEEVVPCFTPGTLIATPEGERLVEDLQVGDRVITRDNGIQEIRWLGRKDLGGIDLARKPHMKPVLIQQGALGKGLPEHDMLVSPNHRVLVANDKTALFFEEREVLVAAKHLTGLDGVDEVETLGVSYIHFMFDQHEVVLSNGAWTESFQPGDYTLKGIGNAQREEILELFPELEHADGLKAYSAARRSLKKHEAALLTIK
ncbi:hypothetical protein AVJ23_20485 [Pseudoponticoccus marisrubri]|uniref:Hint domain-containing protein n=1 Tax=Pseudoponticoccus marisrubri TaxID=1685382 RepID=A0A0W7WEE5_9RHOB|nr:hypothetical protein AVJ23_20485 [Pseudoponticoccus marisrubri]